MPMHWRLGEELLDDGVESLEAQRKEAALQRRDRWSAKMVSEPLKLELFRSGLGMPLL